MKNLIVSIVAIAVGGIILFYVTKDKVDVRYTLSENIPLSFYNDIRPSENIQQLEIKNIGDVSVKKVVVKINKQIDEYSLKKYAVTDSAYISRKAGFELNYPELPPKGSIKLIFKTKDDIIKDEDIEIYDDKGIVYEAFNNSNQLSLWTLILEVIYFILIINSIYTYLIDNVKSRADYNPLDRILKKSKPLYIGKAKWSEIRKEAMEYLFKKDYNSSIERSLSLKVLLEEKDENISENEWIEIVNSAQNEYRKLIEQECFYEHRIINDLLNLKKPKNYDEIKWSKIVETIGKSFSVSKIRSLKYKDIITIQKFLKTDKPLNVAEEQWEDLINDIEDILLYRLINEMNRANDPVNYLKNEGIQLINTDKDERLKKIAANLSELKQVSAVHEQLTGIIEGYGIDKTKPEIISAKEWGEVELFNRKIEEIKKKAAETFAEATKIKQELKPLKEKITKQLDIVDKVLSDPEFIDKIESYNNDFSSGNFDNLRRLAFLNKQVKQ
jgi:hypothetical protein